MLREEDSAFSEEEVGGAWPQPHTATAAATAAATTLGHTTDASGLKAKGVEDPSSSPFASPQLEPALQHVRGDTQHMKESRESAFARAADEAAVSADSSTPTAQAGTTSHRTHEADPSALGATDAHADRGRDAYSIGGDHDSSEQQRCPAEDGHRLGMACPPSASPAAVGKTALDAEQRGKHAIAAAAVHASSSQSRSHSDSRGPPVATVMDAPAHAEAVVTAAPTTSLIAALVSSGAEEAALFSCELARHASQDTISYSICPSSCSSSPSRSSKDREDTCDPASPVVAVDAAATCTSVFSDELQQQSLPRDGNSHKMSGPLLSLSNDPAERSLNASESVLSSPTAVTLWGVHRDLRRKRIKKVSHYILGSLLGEGAYGAVRDCIDINTDNVSRRFQRCAIKIINGNYAKADMPAIFGNRHSGQSCMDGGGSPSPHQQSATALVSPVRGTLKRTSGSGNGGGGGMRCHHGEDQRRQEMFQREMRNLQRFHSKNIIRALDSFTRYNKEYVVLPIAICSVQQLVRQLMRTRWREAVREWRRRQRKALRKHKHTAAAGASRGDEGGMGEAPQQALQPMVLPAVDALRFEDLAFMTVGTSDMDDEESENYDEEDDDATTAATTFTSASATPGHNAKPHVKVSSKINCNSTHARHVDASRRTHDVGAVTYYREDGLHSSGSLSDHDADAASRHSNGGTRGFAGLRGPHASSNPNTGGISHHRHRGLPRVPSTGSNSTTTTTTTTRTIDSYENGNNSSSDTRGVTRRQQRGGAEDETSDLSSCGVHHSTNSNCIHVMSATPIAEGVESFVQHHHPPEGTRRRTGERGSTPPAVAVPSKSLPVDDSRPHLAYPICPTTLLKGIFYQVASGVHYLHQQNVAHNDIKPSNILLFEDGTVKLGDLGSVSETYNDQGTPLCASPELCKYFYGGIAPPPSFSQSVESVGRDAAKPSDMWCCGLLLFYLITGKPGPLPVQLQYFQCLHSSHSMAKDRQRCGAAGASSLSSPAPPSAIVTRYQLYRAIAEQTEPVDLSGLPDMIPPDLGDEAVVDRVAAEAGTDKSSASPYPRNSVRHLLAGLLELDPQRRLTSEQALQHPWLRMTFRVKPNDKDAHHGNRNRKTSKSGRKSGSPNPQGIPGSSTGNGPSGAPLTITRKAPSKQAMEDAIQRDVARRITESRHVQHMLMLDRQRHLQFVADCCNLLNLSIPPEVIRVQPAEPYREDAGVPAAGLASTRIGAGVNTPPAARPAAWQQHNVAATATVGGGRHSPRVHSAASPNSRTSTHGHDNSNSDVATGTVLRTAMLPAVMPPGCVDTELFLPHSEAGYYEQKSGKSEFDLRVLRRKPLLMAQLNEYFHNVVLVQCGYRTGPDPNFQAMRVRAVPVEDETGSCRGGRRRGGSGSGGTQQPAVVILPGAGSTVYRNSPSAGVVQVAALDSITDSDGIFDSAATAGSIAGVLAEDVWGAGPRHQPRVRVDENGNVVSAAAQYLATTADLATAAVAAGRVVGSESTRNNLAFANAASSRDGGSGGAAAATSSSATANRPSQRSAASSLVHAAAGPSFGNGNSNRQPRSSGSSRSAAPAATNSTNSSGHNRYGSAEAMDTQEVMGTAVFSTARASWIHGSSRRVASRGNSNNNNNSSRNPRDASESASEAEHNVAMRESSKCLCGLM
ncbi:hypothetical protein ABL78_6787 [Leptomonas seymouri]|uniref:Protein kinase domain-containing protein n=1 Tax=Leptomonas seymouri TaxID=5684 RepID=A0A0N1PBT1_LEPSE|nr:hypothetical protein ABL78_6787 [Leptomonas seymouri]|eukprot:KPI84162.1 hypothetical protein ABL78_6787 [Leptomonas seymouri]